MDILNHVSSIQKKVVDHGNYRILAEKSGVTYHWLCKFSAGKIKNPGVVGVAKLDEFFNGKG